MALSLFRISLLLGLFSMPMAASAQSAANAARVDFVTGPVVARAASGVSRPLVKGNEITSGETVVTGDGRAQLLFSDQSVVSLQPKTEFKIDEYRFSGRPDGEEKGFFSLIKGGLRTISGLIGKRNRGAYAMRTEVATIGIRGTEYSAELDGGLKVSTQAGEVEVCNQGGCTSVKPGETVFTPNANTKPEHTQSKGTPSTSTSTTNPTLYAGGEQRTPTGGIAVPTLPSGPGYEVSVALIDTSTGLPALETITASTATFDEAGRMSTASGTAVVAGAPASIVAGGHTEGATDGIVAWGRWAVANGDFGGPVSFSQVHYVVGVPTSATALSTLTGIKANMPLIGYTSPTSDTGLTGLGPVTGSFTVQFGGTTIGSAGGNTVVNTNLNVPIGGASIDLTSSSVTGTFPQFTGTFACGGPCTGGNFAGSFYGPAANRAGYTYLFNGGAVGNVSGAVMFGR
ncbi:MAG: hypothetical protein EG825_00850 [Rhodocyclaceae bacterium]|nr:hypothetical protein [Rhodocyclaceae bacterium]